MNPSTPPACVSPDDAALVERYLQHVRVEKRLAQRTQTLYRLDLERLCEHAAQEQTALTDIGAPQVRRWVARMHSGGRSPRGIGLILSGWRGFFHWLGHQALVASNPVQDVRSPKAAKPLPKAMSVDDAVALASFHNLQADPWLEARDAAIVELLYGAGLRVGELVGLDIRPGAGGWLDLHAGEAHVLGKGSKRRAVPMGAHAVAAVQRWLALRGEPETAALFVGQRGTRLHAQTVCKRLRQRSLTSGLAAPVHPHMLRHSMASHVLQSSGDLRAVQELLGHASIATTQVYTRLDFQHLARAYDAAHPRAKRSS